MVWPVLVFPCVLCWLLISSFIKVILVFINQFLKLSVLNHYLSLNNPKGNQPWIVTGRTDAEAPILWPPDAKSRLIGKDPKAGKDWGQEKKGMTEDKMVGWHHWLNGHEFEQTPGDGEGRGSLAWYSSWGRKESDMT